MYVCVRETETKTESERERVRRRRGGGEYIKLLVARQKLPIKLPDS